MSGDMVNSFLFSLQLTDKNVLKKGIIIYYEMLMSFHAICCVNILLICFMCGFIYYSAHILIESH